MRDWQSEELQLSILHFAFVIFNLKCHFEDRQMSILLFAFRLLHASQLKICNLNCYSERSEESNFLVILRNEESIRQLPIPNSQFPTHFDSLKFPRAYARNHALTHFLFYSIKLRILSLQKLCQFPSF